ncbi:hypothetical protein J7L00_04240 [Candidatus Bathyarchaeota archaeon]|nr:hypothetical protein [Candidatus Bathyarchaeota archaeon]
MSFSIAIHELAPITPLALPHQYLLLKKWDEEIDPRILDQHKGKKIPKDLKLSYGFYLVHAVKEIRPFIKDFGALSAWPNGKKTDQELTELKLEASEVAQFRIIPLDDIAIAVKQWTVEGARVQSFITPDTFLSANLSETGKLDEIIVFTSGGPEGVSTHPKVDVWNLSTVAEDMNRIMVYGYRYKVTKVDYVPQYYKPVDVQQG